jgi:hypothetical protein
MKNAEYVLGRKRFAEAGATIDIAAKTKSARTLMPTRHYSNVGQEGR